jgi:hypothetical protein
MPRYTFRNELSGEVSTMDMSIAEMEEFLEKHDWIKWVPVSGLPTLDSVRLGIRKPDGGFRDLLKTIKKGSPRSKINTF